MEADYRVLVEGLWLKLYNPNLDVSTILFALSKNYLSS